MEEVTITKENYKGYVELYKHYMKMDCPKMEIYRKVFSLVIICSLLASLLSYFSFLYSFCFCIIGNFSIVTCGIINAIINRTKTKLVLKEKYPFINYNIKKEKLTELLAKKNILKYNPKNKIYSLNSDVYIDEISNSFEDGETVLDGNQSFCEKNEKLLNDYDNQKQKVKTIGSR